jgi:hypothetical protein
MLCHKASEDVGVGGRQIWQPVPIDGIRVGNLLKPTFRIPNKSHSTCHPGPEIISDTSKDRDSATCHILTAIGSTALNNGIGPRITNSEAYPGLASGEQFARCRPIQAGVADNGVVPSLKRGCRWRTQLNGGAGQALSDVIIGITNNIEQQALHTERAKGLAGTAIQTNMQPALRQVFFSEPADNMRT